MGKLDFALTNRYRIIQDATLPCISKLVQLLESEKEYEDALYIISIYKENGYVIQYQNELFPKEVRIERRISKSSRT